MRGMVWTVGVGSEVPLAKQMRPYQPNLENYWRHMTNQIWLMSSANVTQVDAFDGTTVGGTCMGVWESTGGSKLATVCGVLQGSVLVFKLAAITPLFYLPETLMYVFEHMFVRYQRRNLDLRL
jgi:hypothetical protein